MNRVGRPPIRWEVVHETSTRLRIAVHGNARARPCLQGLRDRLRRLRGVERVRIAGELGIAAIHHDGRQHTREALLRTIALDLNQDERAGQGRLPSERPPPLPIWAESLLLGAGLLCLPALDPRQRRALGLAGIAVHRLLQPPRSAGDWLDLVAKLATVVGGHPAAVLLDQAMETLELGVRGRLLEAFERTLAQLAPMAEAHWRVRRGSRRLLVRSSELRRGDEIVLATPAIVPGDARVLRGCGRLLPLPTEPARQAVSVAPGDLVDAGRSVADGRLRLRLLAPPGRSLAEAVHLQLAHALHARERTGTLQPRLRRDPLMPLALAAVAFGLTRKPGRAAMLLQSDPRGRPELFHPVTREAAILSMAEAGAVPASLEAIHKLALCSVLAIEDTLLLDARRGWRVESVAARSALGAADVRRILLLATDGASGPMPADWPLPMASVALWLNQGQMVADPGGPLHLVGAGLARRVYAERVPAESPERRQLLIFRRGQRLARVWLRAHHAPDWAAKLERLRRLRLRRIAICPSGFATQVRFATAPTVDAVLPADHHAQRAWLETQVLEGEHVGVLHLHLRDIVPSGGLSASPLRAESGAHIALADDVLDSLVRGMQLAQWLERQLQRQRTAAALGQAVLIGAGGLRSVPPWLSTLLRHGLTVWQMQAGAGLPGRARSQLTVQFDEGANA